MRCALKALAIAVLMGTISAYGSDSAQTRDQLKASELPEYDQMRDPFWAVGHTRQVKPKEDPNAINTKEPETPPEIKPQWPQLRLKAVTSSPKGFIAIIEGVGLVEEGQIIKMTVNGIIYRWKIMQITEKGFSHKQLDAKAAK